MQESGGLSAGACTIRPYHRRHRDQVLELLRADCLPGQFPPGTGTLADALAGRCLDGHPQIHGADRPVTDVLFDARGHVAGAVCYALQPRQRAGHVLWAHAGEDFAAMAVLVSWARSRLGTGRPWYAFAGFPAAGPAVAGLPCAFRPATAKALHAAGFTPLTGQHYWHRDIGPHLVDQEPGTHDADPVPRPAGWSLRTGDGPAGAEALMDAPRQGIAHLHGLTLHGGGNGLHTLHEDPGRRLIARCLRQAALCAATGMTAVTDTADPDDPVCRLLDEYGFTLLDAFTVHHRPAAKPPARFGRAHGALPDPAGQHAPGHP
ncbi:hypothetical protein GCM10009663_71530 [Kitasatospora arboriphila]|uniref:N-acetyltransferase n=1 Tax=Kitasatospora arboriphila TaxID=258052 RepID=A0ABN1U5P4_9ACTN